MVAEIRVVAGQMKRRIQIWQLMKVPGLGNGRDEGGEGEARAKDNPKLLAWWLGT